MNLNENFRFKNKKISKEDRLKPGFSFEKKLQVIC